LTDSERNNRIRDTIGLLLVAGIGRGRLHKLIRAFGSVSGVRSASAGALAKVPGISEPLANAIKKEFDQEKALAFCEQIDGLGWAVLFPDDFEYPDPLKHLDQPPPILFRLGRSADPGDRMIAVVGTRRPSEQGRLFANRLGRSLAEAGVVVVSGMAEGIDTAAHQGALDAGGRTVAVWGSSLDQLYPPTNRKLAERIREQGTIYSEYLPETPPDRPHFPERNRIISGLSAGTVVVEAGQKSGALITARLALEQNRAVFAVPGPPGAVTSLGCNELIKEGATLVTEAGDIFRDLPTLRGEVVAQRCSQRPDLTDTEQDLVTIFAGGPIQIDELSRKAAMSISELTQYLLALELKGVIQELSGKRYMLAEDYV
jgi:DNA processing protein